MAAVYTTNGPVWRVPFPRVYGPLDYGKHVIGVWPKHIYSTLLRQRPSILTDWWPGLMTSQEEKQGHHGLQLWHHFDFANRIRAFPGWVIWEPREVLSTVSWGFLHVASKWFNSEIIAKFFADLLWRLCELDLVITRQIASRILGCTSRDFPGLNHFEGCDMKSFEWLL